MKYSAEMYNTTMAIARKIHATSLEYTPILWTLDIPPSNITRYRKQHEIKKAKTLFSPWTHKTHGVLSEFFGENVTRHISRLNTTRYWTQYGIKKAKTLFGLWTHKIHRHPVFGENIPRHIKSTLYVTHVGWMQDLRLTGEKASYKAAST